MGEASFDDLIPLADVPATGDISIIWYGATLLSIFREPGPFGVPAPCVSTTPL